MRATIRFRDCFYFGVAVAVLAGGYLMWLWQPDQQVNRHATKLLHDIETKDWSGVADLVANNYLDQWGEDRPVVLRGLSEAFSYVREGRIAALSPIVISENGKRLWRAKILVEGDGEVLELIKQRVNSLNTPFELEWRHMSTKPWDWQLVRVSNAEFEIPTGFE